MRLSAVELRLSTLEDTYLGFIRNESVPEKTQTNTGRVTFPPGVYDGDGDYEEVPITCPTPTLLAIAVAAPQSIANYKMIQPSLPFFTDAISTLTAMLQVVDEEIIARSNTGAISKAAATASFRRAGHAPQLTRAQRNKLVHTLNGNIDHARSVNRFLLLRGLDDSWDSMEDFQDIGLQQENIPPPTDPVIEVALIANASPNSDAALARYIIISTAFNKHTPLITAPSQDHSVAVELSKENKTIKKKVLDQLGRGGPTEKIRDPKDGNKVKKSEFKPSAEANTIRKYVRTIKQLTVSRQRVTDTIRFLLQADLPEAITLLPQPEDQPVTNFNSALLKWAHGDLSARDLQFDNFLSEYIKTDDGLHLSNAAGWLAAQAAQHNTLMHSIEGNKAPSIRDRKSVV